MEIMKNFYFLLLLAGVLVLLPGLNPEVLAQSEYPGIKSSISFDDVNPLWGPDRETLAFERIYKSRPVEYLIYIFEPFGQRSLTRLVPEQNDDLSHNSFFRWIDIKGEGKGKSCEYVYVKNSDLYVGQLSISKGNPEIDEGIFVSTENSENGYPDYSHKNQIMAFASGLTGVTDIYLKEYRGLPSSDSDKKPGKPLITKDFQDTMPRWSPDGRDLAYASRIEGNKAVKSNMEIFIIRDALSEYRRTIRLTNSEFDETIPTWSPDGKMIAFYSLRVGNANDGHEVKSHEIAGTSEDKVFDLCVVDAENGNEIARAEFVHRQEHRGPVWVNIADELENDRNWIFYISGDYSKIKAMKIEEFTGQSREVIIEELEGYRYGNITDLDCTYYESPDPYDRSKNGVRLAYSALDENHQKRIYFALCDITGGGFFIKAEK